MAQHASDADRVSAMLGQGATDMSANAALSVQLRGGAFVLVNIGTSILTYITDSFRVSTSCGNTAETKTDDSFY